MYSDDDMSSDEEMLAMKADLARLKLQESKLLKSQEKDKLREKLEQQKAKIQALRGGQTRGAANPKGPPLGLCIKYNTVGCDNKTCPFVHMCRSYVDSRCEAGRECSKCHTVLHPCVKAILEQHGIDTKKHPQEILADMRTKLQTKARSNPADFGAAKDGASGKHTTHTPTKMGLCHRYNEAGCERGTNCSYVHMCKSYVQGKCESGKECGKCHDIFRPEVKLILEKYGISTKQKPKDVLADFREGLRGPGNPKAPSDSSESNDSAAGRQSKQGVPKLGLCHRYNVSSCERGSACFYVHMCRSYVQGKCESGRECGKCHDVFHPDVKRVLERHGISTKQKPKDALADFREALRADGNPKIPSDSSEPNVGAGGRQSKQGVPKLGLCHRYNESSCERGSACSYVHMCRSYVQGKCESGRECGKCHAIFTPDVQAVLQKHGINIKQKQKEVLAEFREALRGDGNQTSASGPKETGPKTEVKSQLRVCFHYNGAGCKKGDGCPFLHMCKFYSEGKCEHGKECSKNHNVFSADVKALLEKRGISTNRKAKEVLAELRMSVSGNTGIGEHNPTTSGSSNMESVICYFYVSRGNCRYGQSCKKFHSDLPYQWRWKLHTDEQWNTVSCRENAELERLFCDPTNREYKLQIEQGRNITSVVVMFDTMDGKDAQGNVYKFQRLSTSSSVQFENKPLTTVWTWYWKDELGKLKKYGLEAGLAGNTSNVSSNDIEQAYLNNPEGQLSFTTSQFEYTIDFSKMIQFNVKYKTRREVFRRPSFISEDEVRKEQEEIRRGGKRKLEPSQLGIVRAPTHWKMSAKEEILDHCQIVKIESSSDEYKEIETMFHRTLPSKPIKSIERIENGDLWWNYERKREKMLKRKSESQVAEKRLFHGTKSQYIDPIWHQGFDFRLSGQTSGTAYGQGAYFALNAKYSDSYAEYGSEKAMFVAKVLPGEYVQGTRAYKRPPHKEKDNSSSDLYDSCVNNEANPDIFIIFDNNQIYPEYLIRY